MSEATSTNDSSEAKEEIVGQSEAGGDAETYGPPKDQEVPEATTGTNHKLRRQSFPW
jgi:hypothetical protein